MESFNKNFNLNMAFIFGAFCIFIKCCLFHYLAFNSILVSTIFNDPIRFCAFYLPKLSISIFFALTIFIIRKRIWFICVLLFIDLWCVANLCYLRSSGLLIDAYAISMINNMDGFWTSSFFLLEVRDLYFPMTSIPYIVYALICDFIYKNNGIYVGLNFMFGCLVLLLFHVAGMLCLADLTLRDKKMLFNMYGELFHDRESPKLFDYFYLNPFRRQNREVMFWDASDFSYEVKNLSILHAPCIIISDFNYMNDDKYIMNQNDLTIASRYLNETKEEPSYKNKLIFILLESWENWVINRNIMPFLCDFIENNNHILYATKITSQIAQGSSSDGQFIMNTGLLPIRSGATVFRYPLNKFPNFASLADGKSAVILPHDTKVWNQTMMSPAYGYDTTFVCDSNDEAVFNKTIECINDDFQVVQVLTISSHAPFDMGANLSKLETDKDMPLYLANYLKCFNYTDECLSIILNKIANDSVFSSATVLITGDHTILTPDKRVEFKEYCKKKNLSYNVECNYCPLIIYSPSIMSKKIINEQCYQMDIYPTLLSILNCKKYYWKGLGRDLYRENIDDINIDSLRTLSDKIIRSDFFSNID